MTAVALGWRPAAFSLARPASPGDNRSMKPMLLPLLVAGFVAAFWVGLPERASAARLIAITVTVDGQPVLSGSTTDGGRANPPAVWRYLKTTPLLPGPNKELPRRPAADETASLGGRVRVTVTSGGEAEGDGLHLVPAGGGRDGWLVEPDWVEAHAPPGTPVLEGHGPWDGYGEDAATPLLLLLLLAVPLPLLAAALGLVATGLAAAGKTPRLRRWLALAGGVLGLLALAVQLVFVGLPGGSGLHGALLTAAILAVALAAVGLVWPARRPGSPGP